MLNETEEIREEPLLEVATSTPSGRHGPRFGAVLRALFVVSAGVLLGWVFATSTPAVLKWLYNTLTRQQGAVEGVQVVVSIWASAILGFVLGAGLGNLIASSITRATERWDEMEQGDKVTLFLGIFAGLIASIPFLFLLNAIITVQREVYVPLSMLGVTLGFMTLSVYAIQSMDDILPWNKSRGPLRRRGIKILDTNVIIDGRIYDLARTGFLEGPLYVPGFVLEELQYIADSHDALRRQRGRRGLDVLRLLQADFQLDVRTQDRLAPDIGDDVDTRLVRLARAMGADVITNDFNLNRVAALQNVKVLNINDLALSLRPNVLPLESLRVTLSREGNQVNQGVGYLEDGTMVVVENGKPHIGETLNVVVSQVIQTERGKMIFAEFGNGEDNIHRKPQRRP